MYIYIRKLTIHNHFTQYFEGHQRNYSLELQETTTWELVISTQKSSTYVRSKLLSVKSSVRTHSTPVHSVPKKDVLRSFSKRCQVNILAVTHKFTLFAVSITQVLKGQGHVLSYKYILCITRAS